MTPSRVKLGRTVTFLEYITNVVSSILLPKTTIWNKITFPASNLLNLAELVEKQYLPKIPIQFIAA